jgi:hypothetical protein
VQSYLSGIYEPLRTLQRLGHLALPSSEGRGR